MFYDIIEQVNAFLGYKNKKFKETKNCLFSKGVSPWFWSKIGHFSKPFLKERRGNYFLRCPRTKKTSF